MAFGVLTDEQGATLRRRIGDNISGSYKLTDTELDSIYTAAGTDLDSATVAALQELLGVYAMQVNIHDPQGDVAEDRSDRFKALQSLLAYWEGVTGSTGTLLQTGLLDTGMDREASDTDLLDCL
jgi:hypothetical protein